MLFVELSLNSKELFHLLKAMNRTRRSCLLVLNSRSRDVLIVSVVSRNLLGPKRLEERN